MFLCSWKKLAPFSYCPTLIPLLGSTLSCHTIQTHQKPPGDLSPCLHCPLLILFSGMEGYDSPPRGARIMHLMQYLCSACAWTSQAMPCLCIQEEVVRNIISSNGAEQWLHFMRNYRLCFFFICKCDSQKMPYFMRDSWLNTLEYLSVQTTASLICAIGRKAGEMWFRQSWLLPLFETRNIYVFGEHIVKSHPNGSMFARLTSVGSLYAHLFKTSKWIF